MYKVEAKAGRCCHLPPERVSEMVEITKLRPFHVEIETFCAC
jgi:hypothetical protein